MGVVMKRVVQLGLKTNVNVNVGFAAVYDHRRHLSHIGNPNEIVNRSAMVTSLEAKAVPSEKPEAITSDFSNLSDTYVSHVDETDKDDFLVEIERENSKLLDYLRKRNNDLAEKINHDVDGMIAQLQGQRDTMRAHFDAMKMHLEGIDDVMETKHEEVKVLLQGRKDLINASLEEQRYELEAQLEAAKHDLIKYCMGTVVSLSAIGFAVIYLW